MIDHIVILTLPVFKGIIYSFLDKYCDGCRYNFVFTAEEFDDVVTRETGATSVLISFGTGIIVKKDQLKKFIVAYNFHPAPPEYPGLDPHYFAAYDGALTYGATCHIMTERVDNGPIVMVRRFSVEECRHSMHFLEKAIVEVFEMMDAIFCFIFEENILPPPIHETWGNDMCTKARRIALCTLDPHVSKNTFDKVFHAFQEGVESSNLVVHLHGHRFKYDGERS
ncbi:MAG: hypothetical protein K2X98_04610 [Alphaproteobacteria bacterium]|nr:hypothetical protein [Alphaproteobacteria bacterium]